MNITAILLLTASLQVMAAYTDGQTVTLKVKNAPLKQVLVSIQEQTGYSVLFDNQLVEQAQPITLDVSDMPLNDVMNLCLKDQPFQYTLQNNSIVVKSLTAGLNPRLQKESSSPPITGIVYGPDGQPLPGVNVVIKGTKKGTVTDKDGKFVIEAEEGSVLEISSIGFGKKEIAVNGEKELVVALDITSSVLDEVQYIAYGQTSKRFSVGNVATVKAADIEKQPVQNPLLALQGRVPGIEITPSSGLRGSNVTLRVQGRNSISRGLDPLVIVDGVPFFNQLPNTGFEAIVQGGSPLNYINPADIASIDVLKDADATAIYGSRAANGAILITTKKGKSGRMKLMTNLQQGWGRVNRRLDMMNTRQYLDMRYEAYRNDGIPIDSMPSNGLNYDITFWDTTRYTDWQKELIGGRAEYSNISMGMSGGTNLMQYLVGGTFNRQTNVFPGKFDDKMYTLHFNTNGSSANQKFHFNLSGSYSYDNNKLPNVDLTSLIALAPNAPALYHSDGTLNWETNPAGRSTFFNPLASLNSEFNNTTRNLLGNATISYVLMRGLELRSNIGYTHQHSNIYLPKRLESSRPEDRPFLQRAADFGNREMNSWVVEPQIEYAERLGNGKIQGLLGATFSKNTSEVLSLAAGGFSSDQLMRSLSAATAISVTGSSNNTAKYSALFGRIGYIWKNKYLLNFTARRDGSSKFGGDKRFHNFGSVGAGWIFSEENAIKKALPFFSFGKLRASYGTTGNDQIADYSYLSLYYTSSFPIPYQNSQGLTVFNLPNPNLEWEETKKLQAGIDIGLMNDKVVVSVTYAHNRSSNQLVNYILPSITGFNSIDQNLPATIENTNWEYSISTSNISLGKLKWLASINLTVPKNKLTSFPGIELTSYASGDDGVIVGQPLGVIKVFKYVGVDPVTGMYQVYDMDARPTTTPNFSRDKTEIVNAATKFYGGVGNTFNFKGLTLDVFFQIVRQIGARDFHFFNGVSGTNPGNFKSNAANQPLRVLNHWQEAGDNSEFAKYSSKNFGVPMLPMFSDKGYTSDASFIRLKNVSLSWEVPSSLMQKVFSHDSDRSVQLYFSGQNLLTITKYSGLDPETRSSSTLPTLQMWTAGLRMEL